MNHVKKLLPFVKPYWKLAVLSLVLLTILVFMDLAIPRLVQRLIDVDIAQRDIPDFLRTALTMLGISFLGTLIALGNNTFSIRVSEGLARDLREAIFRQIQAFSYGDIDRFTTGRLMVRLSSDVEAYKRLIQVSLRIGTRAPLLLIGSLVLMITTSPYLALTMLPLFLITVGIIIWFSVKMEPFYRTVQQKLDRLNTILQENIAGARLVKAFVRADYESERFEVANLDFANRNIKVMQMMAGMGPMLAMLINIGVVVVIWVGGLQSINDKLTVGQIVAFINYLMTALGPLGMMTMLSNNWANGIASAQRINEVLETMPEVQEQPNARALPSETPARVAFENVSFHYNGRHGELSDEANILEGLNLTAEPGQTVAILGATGAGKTSLINLIPRFYDVAQGRVTIDGQDVRELKVDSLLAQVGIVPQETVLFSGTIRENIRYGRPEASDAEVVAAAQAAQAHDFIMKLPAGYETRVEERGVNLSGGQKQRIAIARALILKPKILILDDSTSSVDVETETRIQAALYEIMQGRTSFIVAQRISTVLNADKIVVIDMGQIVAEGTHAQLMQTSPVYQEIFESQLGGGVRVEALP
jgi:ATP-binding cassette subfamily B protein